MANLYFMISLVFMTILNVESNNNNNNNKFNKFVVTDFGAIPDGKTDSRKAFESAWKKACETVGGMVSVPRGTTFFVSGADFIGPCNGPTLFHNDGRLIASDDPTFGAGRDYWITFAKLDRLTIFGHGVFDGNGALSWSRCRGLGGCADKLPPTSLKIIFVTHASIVGVRFSNSKMFHVFIYKSSNVRINKVHISAPGDSPNTDGIHIADSYKTLIKNSYIATGDDCVSIGKGSNNVKILGVWCGPGHGISIGSLGREKDERSVSEITVKNCTFNDTDNGLRIKTWAPSSSNVVSGVVFANIIMNNVVNPILIDQFYCPRGSCDRGESSSVKIKGVKFVNIRGTSTSETSINIHCSKNYPCQDIEFFGLNLTTRNGQRTTALCVNADDRFGGSNQIPSRCSSSSLSM